ncbi:transposase [Endozoicomonas montiporae]|uniref:IS1182 family transposase n=1 Tax=Endozoicomonas montiporae CL-33 TaxID=570277 RepID=A0A142BAQ3_9GAMM|nr:transposase [Endozoicomonas montiporae]AMO55829.1 IS1182 family transposase [Endozoicomonas montiporae CL-33]
MNKWTFRTVDRNTPDMFPASVNDYLPERHLARFVVEIIEQLDLGPFIKAYSGRGSKAWHPSLMISLLFYGYTTGVFSSRKLEKATYDSVAFRFICANEHPDHDSINAFRKRFRKEISALFTRILMIAKEAQWLKMGTISLDGTKMKANASKHKALSYEYACKLEKQLKAEVDELLKMAEEADAKDLPEELSIPEELERREDRLAVIVRAKAEIERRAEERYQQELEEYKEKVARREAIRESGKKPRGKEPKAPEAGPKDKDQVNLTDPDSRIMPTSGGGFEQAYNVQAAVDVDSGLIVEKHVTQATNDKQQVEPASSE